VGGDDFGFTLGHVTPPERAISKVTQHYVADHAETPASRELDQLMVKTCRLDCYSSVLDSSLPKYTHHCGERTLPRN
jgi:hypothetical protein